MTLLTLHDCPSMFSFVFQSLISMDCDEDITPSDHQHNTSIEKTIPVLVPNRCHESLQWLSNYSVCAQVGIENKKYIFASGSSKNPVLTPKDALLMLRKEAQLIHPERLTGCGVRLIC